MAWFIGGEDPVVVVRRPFDKVLFPVARIAHEIGHDRPDEGHHPWWHFCLRSPIAIRFRWIHSRVSRKEAVDLLGRR